jgi:hypothetical protein
MAFNIIFFVITLVQLGMAAKRFRFVETLASKAPYILLTVVLLFSALFYLVAAIFTRVQGDMSFLSAVNFAAFVNFLWATILAFFPAIPLYIIYVRGDIHQAAQGTTNPFNPIMSQMWKRILDWALVGLVYILKIAVLGMTTSLNIAYYNDTISYYQYLDRFYARRDLAHAAHSFLVILYANVIASAIFMFIQLRGRQIVDEVCLHFL